MQNCAQKQMNGMEISTQEGVWILNPATNSCILETGPGYLKDCFSHIVHFKAEFLFSRSVLCPHPHSKINDKDRSFLWWYPFLWNVSPLGFCLAPVSLSFRYQAATFLFTHAFIQRVPSSLAVLYSVPRLFYHHFRMLVYVLLWSFKMWIFYFFKNVLLLYWFSYEMPWACLERWHTHFLSLLTEVLSKHFLTLQGESVVREWKLAERHHGILVESFPHNYFTALQYNTNNTFLGINSKEQTCFELAS